MAKEIIWTALALEDLQNVESYLAENWPNSVTESFFKKLADTLKLISKHTSAGELQFDSVHSIPITKYNKLFYHVDEFEISILRLYDMRQDPSKFKLT